MQRKNRSDLVALAAAAALAGALAPAVRADTTVSFQEGVDGYTGTVDMRIRGDTGAGQTGTALGIDGYSPDTDPDPTIDNSSPDQQLLLRFDNIFGNGAGQVPLGAFILDAQLQLTSHSSSTAGSPGPFGIAPLLSSFAPGVTTYDTYDTSGGADARGTGGNRGAWYANNQSARPLAGYRGLAKSVDPTLNQYSASIAPIVQSWSDGTRPQNGVAVQAGFVGTNNAWSVRTHTHSSIDSRPKLSVTYTTDPVSIVSFRQGENGYGGSTMAYVTSDRTFGDFTTDGNIEEQNWIDLAANDTDAVVGNSALVKFENIFGETAIPDDAQIRKAWLVITSADEPFSGNVRSGGQFQAGQMDQAWTTSSLYSSFDPVNGPVGSNPDIKGGMTTGSEVWFDVTQSLVNFQDGSVANNGWAIRSNGTSDGWAIYFNGASDISVRPELVVAYSVPEPMMLGALALLAPLALPRRRR